MNDAQMRDMLTSARTVAVVGHSDDPTRASYQIAAYLRRAGYTVYAVNPTLTDIDGQPVYATLADVPESIDIVNVFRGSRHLPDIVRDALAIGAKGVWAQLEIDHPDAQALAAQNGLPLVVNRCIKVEHARLGITRG